MTEKAVSFISGVKMLEVTSLQRRQMSGIVVWDYAGHDLVRPHREADAQKIAE